LRRAVTSLFIVASLTSSAGAQEVIATGVRAPMGGAPVVTAPGPIAIQDHFDRGDDIVRAIGPCGAPARTVDGKLDKTPHGEVFAGVGTRGYREVGGVVCLPLGEHGAATIAVDVGQMNGRGWRR